MASKKNVKTVKDEIDIKEGIVLVCVLTLIVLVIYALTLGAQKIGLFDVGYTKPEISSAVISYENTIAGNIFNKIDSEYYVLIADFSSNDNIHVNTIGSLYSQKENHLPLYSVDLNEFLNKSIIGETSNPGAQNVSELKVNGPTLIHIKDGRNYNYYEGVDNIKSALGV